MSKLARLSAAVVMGLVLALSPLTGGASAQTLKAGNNSGNHMVTAAQTRYQNAQTFVWGHRSYASHSDYWCYGWYWDEHSFWGGWYYGWYYC